MRRLPADVLMLATVLLWAMNFTVSKYILTHGFRPLSYSSLRYALAGALFAALTFPRERSFRIDRRDAGLVAFSVGVLFLNQLCFIYALRFATATTVALLFGTLPIFTALFSHAVGVETLRARFWVAALLSFCGVALVAVGSGGGLSADVKGHVLPVLGAASWAAYSVAIAPLMRRYSPYRLSAVVLVAAAAALLVAGAPQLAEQHFEFGPLVWIGFAFAVLGPLVLTNVLWFTAIDRVGPSHASLFANLQPFLAAVIALVLLAERMTPLQVAGGLAIGAAVLLSRRSVPDAGA